MGTATGGDRVTGPAVRRTARALLAPGLVLAGLVAPAAPVAATPAHRVAAGCAGPGEVTDTVPWSQQLFAPERVWAFTRGGGITVAVLDSGVDGNHPRLRGHVTAGFDAVAGRGPANTDCRGTGTQVAGVIAARPAGTGGAAGAAGPGFSGLAPDVTILPVRVTTAAGRGTATADPKVLARGILAAVDRGAQVVAVSAVSYTDTPELRAAVTDAQARGAVVVAAVGDLGDRAPGAAPTPYPAGYDGVVGVGAIGRSGDRWPGSQRGGYVDLVAPGADVVTLQPGRGMAVGVAGTRLACGYVAATAALTRAKRRDLGAAEVTRLLLATTTPAAAGPDYGNGVVNPYSAVNEQLAKGGRTAVGDAVVPPPAVARPAPQPGAESSVGRRTALTGTLLVVLVAVVVAVLSVGVNRLRRRGAAGRSGPVSPRAPW
jgi:type VII secretion-associated serine protease mycosin